MGERSALYYLLPVAGALAYILWLQLTRQRLVRSALESLRTYTAGVKSAFPDTKPELEGVLREAGPKSLRLRPDSWSLSEDRVLRGWRTARTIELANVPRMRDSDVCARAVSLVPLLEARAEPTSREIARRLRAALENRGDGSDPLGCSRAELLREGMRWNFDERDTTYETLANEHNRASWLANFGTVVAAALVLIFGNGGLVLVGAAGGFLSRLSRVLYKRPLPNDYGASWGPLMLAPVAGGLAGWFGVLFVGALNDVDFNVVAGDAIKISWKAGVTPVNLAVAFLFGFSERLLNRAASATETLLPSASAPVSSGTVATPGTPGADPRAT